MTYLTVRRSNSAAAAYIDAQILAGNALHFVYAPNWTTDVWITTIIPA